VLTDETNSRELPSITARPTRDERQRFATIAAERGLSESKLALVAIRALLESAGYERRTGSERSSQQTASDRITIRLRPGDRLAIRERAGQRGLKDSAYIAALVRSHVGANPPLTGPEVAALKASVAVLAGFGRLLARMSREVSSNESLVAEELRRTSSAAATLSRIEAKLSDKSRIVLS
jgi:hypothetical protein